VGARARIAHFGGSFEDARVIALSEDGRILEVLGEHGRRLRFELNRASARFTAAGSAAGERLELLGD